MIKSAISYSVEMPSLDEMRKFIDKAELNVTRPSAQQMSTFGFDIHPVTRELVSSFEGGYCLTFKKYEKKIKPAALREVLNAKYQNFEAELGRPLKQKEKASIKEDTIIDLLPNILPEPKVVFGYFDIKSKTLVIDTTEAKMADMATSLLRKCFGSLKATTLYIDASAGLTERLADFMYAAAPNAPFIPGLVLGGVLELKHPVEGEVKYKDMNLTEDGTSVEIVDMIRDTHMYVKTIRLGTQNHTWFDLTDGFKMKGIKYDYESDTSVPKHETWQSDTWYSMNQIVSILGHITKTFEVITEG